MIARCVDKGGDETPGSLGYDRIPNTLPTGGVTDVVPGELDPRDDELRDVMIGLGFTECVTYALTSETRLARLVSPDLLDADLESPLGDAETWDEVHRSAMNDAGRALTDRLLRCTGRRCKFAIPSHPTSRRCA